MSWRVAGVATDARSFLRTSDSLSLRRCFSSRLIRHSQDQRRLFLACAQSDAAVNSHRLFCHDIGIEHLSPASDLVAVLIPIECPEASEVEGPAPSPSFRYGMRVTALYYTLCRKQLL